MKPRGGGGGGGGGGGQTGYVKQINCIATHGGRLCKANDLYLNFRSGGGDGG